MPPVRALVSCRVSDLTVATTTITITVRCPCVAQLMALTVASSLQLGPTWVAQYAIVMSMAGFYAAQWEECASPAAGLSFAPSAHKPSTAR